MLVAQVLLPTSILRFMNLGCRLGLVVWGFEPLGFVEGKWETPPDLQATNPSHSIGGKLIFVIAFGKPLQRSPADANVGGERRWVGWLGSETLCGNAFSLVLVLYPSILPKHSTSNLCRIQWRAVWGLFPGTRD